MNNQSIQINFQHDNYYNIIRLKYNVDIWSYCFYWQPYQGYNSHFELHYIVNHKNHIVYSKYHQNDQNNNYVNSLNNKMIEPCFTKSIYDNDFDRSYILNNFHRLYKYYFIRQSDLNIDDIYNNISENIPCMLSNDYCIQISKHDNTYTLNDNYHIHVNDEGLIVECGYHNNVYHFNYFDSSGIVSITM
jgi:hypothetical protein